ncbi:hypothetical protein AUJ83_01370 [Candidatus Woesearchaeota archaeon CG1_02_33_12]|nr:MAG: hypothetical protein AUJ83_01370 [Candidatus Woesearchaeota archaeon CG1_02_33_12]PIN79213.1 MAG: hypothetical protein COV14_00300 [Candidatus Woesearchaeota archaeon CG10_big_fil_rev_8_21_14_0_10_33_12]
MIKIAKNNLLPEDANLILNDVVPKHEFNIHMGTSIKNLQELAEALEIMGNDAFKHHVTKEKNDFSNWVKDIIEDVELSNDLLKAKTRKKAFETVSQRIEQLEKLKSGLVVKDKTNFFTDRFLIGLIFGLALGFVISAIINNLV